MRIPLIGHLSVTALLALSACGDERKVERVELSQVSTSQPQALDSPDTRFSFWSVGETGRTINYGDVDEPPMMSVDCLLGDGPPQMRIIRHAPARPGKTALFPVVGNQIRSRFLVETALEDGEWRWQGTVEASDPKLDVFTGPRQLLATLPGGGMIDMAGSTVPWQFVTWCRAGGMIEAEEAARIAGQAVETREEITNSALNR